ncbi:MAG: hypothetical protein ACLQU1_12290 [Bryobacteraceae bacterium]
MADVIVSPDIEDLSKLYVLRQPAEVEEFLHRNPRVAALLRIARPEIDRYFGAHALRVELTLDPCDPSKEFLFAMIECDLDADDAIDRLQELERRWWADASYAAHLPLNIDVEFGA